MDDPTAKSLDEEADDRFDEFDELEHYEELACEYFGSDTYADALDHGAGGGDPDEGWL